MPVEITTNVICEQCGRYADGSTYVKLATKKNVRVEVARDHHPLSMKTYPNEDTFDVVFCSFRCTKQYIEQIT